MIKVGYLVSYDYNMFLTSARQLYAFVDKIVIAIDKDYKTWSGNKFVIPNSFFDEVKAFDTRNIIEFYFDNFYISILTPMECESRERNLVLKKLGRGWKIQLDVDEYVYDFKEVSNYLMKYWYLTLFPKFTPLSFSGRLITLFKKVENGFVFIDNGERFPFITNQDFNSHARGNKYIKNFYSNISAIHQSWAREEDEIKIKVENWGHRDDFDTKNYMQFWKKINEENYSEIKNFHPIAPHVWSKLYYLKANTIEDFIREYASLHKQNLIPISFNAQIKALKNKFFRRC